MYETVFLPCLHCEAERMEMIKKFFHLWSEVLWIFYLTPDAQRFQGLRLRLHVLTFILFELCAKLFPDPLVTTITKGELITKIKTILEQKGVNGHRNQNQHVRGVLQTDKCISKLLVPELLKLHGILSGKPTNASTKKTPRVATINTIYYHNTLIHAADLYETIALSNVSTERGEGFLATAKHEMQRSSRNLYTPQPVRSVWIRHSMKARVLARDGVMRERSTYTRISKAFSEHKFSELEVAITEFNKEDVSAFVRHLLKFKYTTPQHWVLTEEPSLLRFNTLSDTEEVWKKWGGKVI